PEEKTVGRAALGAGLEVCRWQADGGDLVRFERTEDKAVPRGARQAENQRYDAAGRYFDGGKQEPGVEFAQHRRSGTGAGERSASLSHHALHPCGVRAAGARKTAGFAEEVGIAAYPRGGTGLRKEETSAAPA